VAIYMSECCVPSVAAPAIALHGPAGGGKRLAYKAAVRLLHSPSPETSYQGNRCGAGNSAGPDMTAGSPPEHAAIRGLLYVHVTPESEDHLPPGPAASAAVAILDHLRSPPSPTCRTRNLCGRLAGSCQNVELTT
jgi:hypothetical protein